MIIIIKIIMIIVIIFSMTIITKIATIIIYNVYGSWQASDQTTDAQTFRGIESTLVTFTPITPSTAARNVTYLILVMKIVEIQQIIK